MLKLVPIYRYGYVYYRRIGLHKYIIIIRYTYAGTANDFIYVEWHVMLLETIQYALQLTVGLYIITKSICICMAKTFLWLNICIYKN